MTESLETGNLFSGLPDALPEECVTTLAEGRHCVLRRIVSTGHISADGFWYDQDEDEWVVVLTGGARLLIEGEEAPRKMGPGDYVFIPAHVRHRIAWTDPDRPTVWLALHVEH